MAKRLWSVCGGLSIVGAIASVGGPALTTTSAQEQRPQTLQIVPVLPEPTVPVVEPPLRPGARMKRFQFGKKIVESFDASAGDRDVVVERWENDGEGEGPPPGVSDVAWRTIFSPVVMVVRVNSIQGYVTEDGTWIESLITGTVIRLLKNSTPTDLQVDAPVSFVTSGGQIRVDDYVLQAVTRTALYRTKELRINGEYLVFAVKRAGGTLYAHQKLPTKSSEIDCVL